MADASPPTRFDQRRVCDSPVPQGVAPLVLLRVVEPSSRFLASFVRQSAFGGPGMFAEKLLAHEGIPTIASRR